MWQTDGSGLLERRICDRIEAAESVVIVCSFLLASGPIAHAMRSADGRGVRCYVMTAPEEVLARPDAGLTEFDEHRIDEHRALLDELSSFALVRTAPHFHAKAVLIDPLDHPSGILSTANLVSQSLRQSVDLAVDLPPGEVIALFDTLRWGFWETAERELAGPGELNVIAPTGAANRGGHTDALWAISAEKDSITAAHLHLLDATPSKVIASNYGWDDRHPVVQALCELAAASCEVLVFARPDHLSALPALERLAASGATILGIDRMHAKVLLADAAAVVASSNFTASHPGHRLEVGVQLEAGDPRFEMLTQLAHSWIASARWTRPELAGR